MDEQYDIEEKISSDGFTIEEPNVILNPYGNSPLTALVIFETNESVSPKVTIKGKDELSTFETNLKFDIEMLKAVCEIVNVPVIASGGAGGKQDFVDLFNTVPGVSAGLAASIFHYGEVTIDDLKKTLNDNNITVRL